MLGTTPVFKRINAVAVVAGTPADVWTPAVGKRFRLLGYSLGVTVAAASIFFREGAANAQLNIQTPVLAINGGANSPYLGQGALAAAVDNILKIDVSANATVTGFVWGVEE